MSATWVPDCSVYDIDGEELVYDHNNASNSINVTRFTFDLDRCLFHQDFNLPGKLANLLKEHGDDVVREKWLRKEGWFVLKAKRPGVSARQLARQYGLEERRLYINRAVARSIRCGDGSFPEVQTGAARRRRQQDMQELASRCSLPLNERSGNYVSNGRFQAPLLLRALQAGAVPAGGFGSVASLKALGYKSFNEKLNLAGIGVGGRGAEDLRGCESENIVALCDVDSRQAGPTFKRYEKATQYSDFRKMLDKEGKNIDACVIATADHMHATVARACMERGKGVYVEKPLTRTPWEARLLTEAAAKYKVATQMGNQGYSHEAHRTACEIIWSGEIGNVTEVHAVTGAPSWPQGIQEIPPPDPVPAGLDWDLWLGGAAMRPYASGGWERITRRTALAFRAGGSIYPTTGAGSTISAQAR